MADNRPEKGKTRIEVRKPNAKLFIIIHFEILPTLLIAIKVFGFLVSIHCGKILREDELAYSRLSHTRSIDSSRSASTGLDR